MQVWVAKFKMESNKKDGITPSEVAQVHGHDQVCKELEKESQTELTQSKVSQMECMVMVVIYYHCCRIFKICKNKSLPQLCTYTNCLELVTKSQAANTPQVLSLKALFCYLC